MEGWICGTNEDGEYAVKRRTYQFEATPLAASGGLERLHPGSLRNNCIRGVAVHAALPGDILIEKSTLSGASVYFGRKFDSCPGSVEHRLTACLISLAFSVRNLESCSC